MRCRNCEEPIDVLDLCESCDLYRLEPPPLSRRGQMRSVSAVKGVCIRGHAMRWADIRWRCKQCEAMYNDRKRQRRRAER